MEEIGQAYIVARFTPYISSQCVVSYVGSKEERLQFREQSRKHGGLVLLTTYDVCAPLAF